jgi:putative oxidoreductase
MMIQSRRLLNTYKVLEIACCAWLLLLFIHAGLTKWLNLPQAIVQFHNQPLPGWMSIPLVIILPALEIATALALIPARSRTTALYAAAILLSIFSIYAMLILSGHFGHIPCACGGLISTLGWKKHLLLTLCSGAWAVAVILIRRWQPFLQQTKSTSY